MAGNDRPIGFWLKLVDRLIDDRFARVIEEHGITRRQWQLLRTLANGPATGAELDARVAPFLPAETGESSQEHLAELVDSGWVAIETDAERYAITEQGTLALGRLTAVVDGIRDALAEGFTREEYDATVASLARMARNLGWDGA